MDGDGRDDCTENLLPIAAASPSRHEQCYKIIGFSLRSLIELAWLIAEKTSLDYTLVIWDRTFYPALIISRVILATIVWLF